MFKDQDLDGDILERFLLDSLNTPQPFNKPINHINGWLMWKRLGILASNSNTWFQHLGAKSQRFKATLVGRLWFMTSRFQADSSKMVVYDVLLYGGKPHKYSIRVSCFHEARYPWTFGLWPSGLDILKESASPSTLTPAAIGMSNGASNFVDVVLI